MNTMLIANPADDNRRRLFLRHAGLFGLGLARAAASILGDEAMHWAVLRNALGEDPVPAAFIA